MPPQDPLEKVFSRVSGDLFYSIQHSGHTHLETSEPTPHKETQRGYITRITFEKSMYIPTFCINLSIREIEGICHGRVPKSLQTSDMTMHQNSNLPNHAVYRESILGSQSGCDALRAELPPTSIQFCLDHFQGSPHCR